MPSNFEPAFHAMAQGKCDYTIPVIRIGHEEYGDLMTICATEEAVYITKQEAMDFFGLKDV